MLSSVPKIPGVELDQASAQEKRHEVRELLGRTNTSFPVLTYSFARHHVQELAHNDYYVCEKSDGVSVCYTAHATHPGGEVHYLIDRKNRYYQINGLHLPSHGDPELIKFHERSILDGSWYMID
jgi:mRNA guanylyltransferase